MVFYSFPQIILARDVRGQLTSMQRRVCVCVGRQPTLYSSLKSLPSSADRSRYSSSRWSTGRGRYVLAAEADLGRSTAVCCSVGTCGFIISAAHLMKEWPIDLLYQVNVSQLSLVFCFSRREMGHSSSLWFHSQNQQTVHSWRTDIDCGLHTWQQVSVYSVITEHLQALEN